MGEPIGFQRVGARRTPAKIVNGTAGGMVLVKDMAFLPTKDTPIHIDFLRLKERMVVSVPLRFTHEEKSPGIKRGGVLNIIHYTLELSVLSKSIPQEILVDLTGMDIGQTLQLNQITLPEGAKALHVSEDEGIVSVVAPSGLTESLKEESQAAG